MKERQIQISGLSVCYKIIGAGKTPVVLLHGWGLSSDRYVATAEEISKRDDRFVFYIPDLPGFGQSQEPDMDWKLDDYAAFTEEFIRSVALRSEGFESAGLILERKREGSDLLRSDGERVILLGHSFGGRIALKYAAERPERLELLVLTGAAGIKHPLSFKQGVIFSLSRAGKVILSLPVVDKLEKPARSLLYRLSPDKDYGRADERMKAVMRSALAEDLTPLLEEIRVPTLLIWGQEDHSTPLADARLMQTRIPEARLFVIEGANHSAVYNRAPEFAEIFARECAA